MWRINPKECNYELLNPNNDIFSSKAVIVGSFDLREGDYICAVASGKGKGRGLWGIWEVTKPQFYGPMPDGQACYLPPHDERRKEAQYRVQAKLYLRTTSANSVKNIISKKQLYIPPPSKLSYEQFQQLCALTVNKQPKIKISFKVI